MLSPSSIDRRQVGDQPFGKMKAGSIQLQTDVAKTALNESGLRLAPVCDIQVHVTGPDSPDGPDPLNFVWGCCCAKIVFNNMSQGRFRVDSTYH